MPEAGRGKIACIVDDRPDSVCFRVNSIGAEFITGLVRAENEFLGAADILVNRINPVAILIAGN